MRFSQLLPAPSLVAGSPIAFAVSPLLVLALACGGTTHHKPGRDAGAQEDAGNPHADAGRDGGNTPAPMDASSDANGGQDSDAGSAAHLPETLHASWVASQITLNVDADKVGFDFTGDGKVDNRLAQIYATVSGLASINAQSLSDTQVTHGAVILLMEANASSFTDGSAHGRVLQGSMPMPPACTDETDVTCGHHLDGKGSFVAVTPAPELSAGKVKAAQLSFGPGEGSLPVFMSNTPVWVPLHKAQLTGKVTSEGLTDGVYGGAIASDDVNTIVLPELQVTIAATIMRDCPTGPASCASNSTGQQYLTLLDADKDGKVTIEELKANNLIMGLLQPDVDLDANGTNDALSAAVGINGVLATFPEP
jgi:hypothetical protein